MQLETFDAGMKMQRLWFERPNQEIFSENRRFINISYSLSVYINCCYLQRMVIINDGLLTFVAH